MNKNIIMALIICILFAGTTAYAGDVGEVDIHGFISQGFLYTTDNNWLGDTEDGSWEFNEAGINFGTWLTADLRVGIQFFARDLGALGNDEITVDWAYGDYRWKEWLGIRAGKIKIPNGLYNEIRDVDMLRTSIFLPQSGYLEITRDSGIAMKGIGIYGRTPDSAMGSLGYQLLYGTMEMGEDSGSAMMAADRGVTVTSFNVENTSAAALEWETPLDGLRFGVSARRIVMEMNGISSSGSTVYQDWDFMDMYNAYFEFIYEELIVAGEFNYGNTDAFMTISPGPPFPIDRSNLFNGFYLSLAYRVTDWFMPEFYYSHLNSQLGYSDDDKTVLKHFSTSLRFDITDSWIVKLQYVVTRGTIFLMDFENPDGMDPEWDMLAVKLTYAF